MTTQRITREDISSDKQLKSELLKISKKNPSKYVTFFVTFGKTRIFLNDRKPQSNDADGSEDTYKFLGGFLKNGQVVKPSKSFISRYDFIPVSR